MHFIFPRSTVRQDCAGGSSALWLGLGHHQSSEQPCLSHCGLAGESDFAPSLLLPLHFSHGGDLLLLLCGCLHCQGMGKFTNILLVQQGKALGGSKTNCFGCRKLRGEEGTSPSLASASCQQHLLEVICSLLPSLHSYSVIPFCQNDPTCKSLF